MKRSLGIGFAVIAVLLAVALIAPSFIDWNKYKPRILAQLHAATGYDFDISGPLQLAVLPAPHVVVNGVTVKGQGGATLLTLDKAEVHVALLPLLGGRIDISSVTLDRPVIDVGVDKNGQASWAVVKPAQQPADTPVADAAAKGKSGGGFILHSLKIEDGSVRYADARSGASYAATNIDLALTADGMNGPFGLKGSADYHGETVKLSGQSGALDANDGGVPVKLRLEVPSADGVFSYDGTAGMKQPYAANGRVSLQAGDLDALLAVLAGHAVTGYRGKADLDGTLAYDADALKFTDARLALGKVAMNGDIAVTGLRQQASISASMKAADTLDLDDLAAQFGAGKKTAAAPSSSAAGDTANKAGGWLPAKLALPFQPVGKIVVSAPAVTYRGQSFPNASIQATMNGRSIATQVQAGLPGNGAFALQGVLAFASTQPSGTKGVILSNPSLTYKLDVKDQNPAALAALAPAAQRVKAERFLSQPVALTATGAVGNAALTVNAATLAAMNTSVALGGSYTAARGDRRAHLAATASAGDLDLDRILGPSSEQPAEATAKSAAAPATRQAMPSVSLPFDLDLNAAARTVRYKGAIYSGVNIKGGLAGSGLTIDTAGFRDASGNSLSATGVVGDIRAMTGIDVTVRGSTPDADALMAQMKIKNPLNARIGEAALAVDAKGRLDSLNFAATARALRGTLTASGVVTGLPGKPDFSALTFRLQHPNYEQLAQIFRPNFHAGVDIAKTLDVSAAMQKTGTTYAFNDLKIAAGPAAGLGTVKLDMGATPSIAANMQFADLPLDKLLGTQASKSSASAGGSQTIQAAAPRASTGHWSRDPINTDWMRKWNADVRLTASSASYGNWKFTNAAMNFALKDGTLSLTKMQGGLYGGQIDMTASMAGQGGIDASSKMSLRNVNLESFAQSFMSSRLVRAQGTINMNADVAAKGASMAALISALNGKAAMTGGDIVFQGFDLARISTILAQPTAKTLTGNLGGALTGGSTRFDKLDGAFTIQNGVVNFDKMALTGPDANVNSGGNINLPLWTIALENVVALPPVNGKTPPPLKIAFNGPLDNPSNTFGKDALQNFITQQYGNKIQNQLNKLDKSGKLGGVLGGVLGLPQQAPAAATPTATPAAIPNTTTDTAPAAVPDTTQQAEPPKKIKPKDLLKGFLNNALQQGQ